MRNPPHHMRKPRHQADLRITRGNRRAALKAAYSCCNNQSGRAAQRPTMPVKGTKGRKTAQAPTVCQAVAGEQKYRIRHRQMQSYLGFAQK
jgi:hypothetical protein